jgi:hypothetical protein
MEGLKMQISSLEVANQVVSKNPDLDWNGWEIVHDVQDDSAEYSTEGIFKRVTGKWYRRISYPFIEGTGWDIPSTLIRV